MIGLAILFSRKYEKGEGVSDKNVAPHLKDSLGMEVFETTFKTPLGFKKRISYFDRWTREYTGKSVLVVHYDDPSIFSGLIQKIIPNRFFLFYDEKTKLGGLSYASTKGQGSKSLCRLYQFKMFDVSELFHGNSACDGHYAILGFQPWITDPCPVGQPWRLLGVDDPSPWPTDSLSIYKAVLVGQNIAHCRHYRTYRNHTAEIVGEDKFNSAFNYVLRFRAHPFSIKKAWPILGTHFVIIAEDIASNRPRGDKKVIYFGRRKISSEYKLTQKLEKILNLASY